jgi:hypothetical protein
MYLLSPCEGYYSANNVFPLFYTHSKRWGRSWGIVWKREPYTSGMFEFTQRRNFLRSFTIKRYCLRGLFSENIKIGTTAQQCWTTRCHYCRTYLTSRTALCVGQLHKAACMCSDLLGQGAISIDSPVSGSDMKNLTIFHFSITPVTHNAACSFLCLERRARDPHGDRTTSGIHPL